MKEKFALYPELVMVDATYKLNNFRMPVFLTIVIDGNGETEIVAVYIVVTEDRVTLKCLLEMFQRHNPAWTEIKTVLTDKDMTERSVFKELMPHIRLQLCLFHVLKSMSREIHCEKMGLRIEEKNRCLEIIQVIAYSKTVQEYEANVQKLRDTNIQPVIDYFVNSWDRIHEEWVIGLKGSCHYSNNTTNRIESMNQKLKQVITKFSNLKSFFKELEICISTFRQERDSRTSNVLTKRRLCSYPPGSAQAMFMELLTPHAYQIVVEQLFLAERVKLPAVVNGDMVRIQTCFGEGNVNIDSCSCKFVTFNELPCRHIFALRSKLGLHMFTDSVVSKRWKLLEYLRAFRSTPASESNDSVLVTALPKRAVLTQHQKYKAAFHVSQKLASLASEGSMALYSERIKLLENVLNIWEKGHQAAVCNLNNMDDVSDIDSTIPDVQVLNVHSSAAVAVDVVNPEPLESSKVKTSIMKKVNRPELLSTVPPPTRIQETLPTTRPSIELSNSPAPKGIEVVSRPSVETSDNTLDTSVKVSDIPVSNLSVVEPTPKGSEVVSRPSVETSDDTLPTRKPLSMINLPSKMNVKGRPKGRGVTVIGLSRKKSDQKTKVAKPIPFSKKMPVEKDRSVLRWFVSGPATEAAISGVMLTIADVKKTRDISHACRHDDGVLIPRIRKYFEQTAWNIIRSNIIKVNKIGWLCSVCKTDLDEEQIGCDGCLEWLHLRCSTLKKPPKTKKWFCNSCCNNC